MHIVTQVVVLRGDAHCHTGCGARLDYIQGRLWCATGLHPRRPGLVAALAVVLASKLLKFNLNKPATFSIGLRYARHAGALAARAREWGVLPVAWPSLAGSSRGVDAGQGGAGADRAVLDNIAVMCEQAGIFFDFVSARPREALRMFEAALDSAVARHGDNHPSVAASYGNIGNMYQAQGEYDEAHVQHQKSLEIKICVFGCEGERVAASYNNIGAVYFAQGDYKNALLQYQKSLKIEIRVLGCDSSEVATLYNNIGAVYEKQGDNENALKQYHKSLEIKIRVFGCKSPDVAMSYNNIAGVYKSQGDYENALRQHQNSLDIKFRVYGQEHPLVASSYHNIGNVHHEQG